jgi:hypothetical protein
VSAADRRTAGKLLADSDALARETLLDITPITRLRWCELGISWPGRRQSCGRCYLPRLTEAPGRTRCNSCE